MYLLQVIGNVDDLLAGDANNDVDQLLDHSCLFMDNSKVQRPIERVGWPLGQLHASAGTPCCPQSPHSGSNDNKTPTLPSNPLCAHVSPFSSWEAARCLWTASSMRGSAVTE